MSYTQILYHLDAIIRHVANQEDHHRTVTFAEEFEAMLKAAGIEYDPRYI